ncbi:MAG: hypothetical protein WA252_05830 [Candidatus Sulfotelmatobacter sp.]
MTGDPTQSGEFLKEFARIVIASPVALVTLVLSAFLGYGISFILFDYRRLQVRKSHYMFHVVFGLGYTAVIFLIVNYDLLSRTLTASQIMGRMPLTLLVSFAVGFTVMLAGAIVKDAPARRRPNGNGD